MYVYVCRQSKCFGCIYSTVVNVELKINYLNISHLINYKYEFNKIPYSNAGISSGPLPSSFTIGNLYSTKNSATILLFSPSLGALD